ncbi:hypothetical protein GGR55DRAFT_628524 [Xylaria sp. FL0064]|nr:hypothetical protein GGR55DRAFT_628524 [Xylaria sp. FL0064]
MSTLNTPVPHPGCMRRHSTGSLRDVSPHDEPQVQLEHCALNDLIPEEDSVAQPDVHSTLPLAALGPLPILTLRPESPEFFIRRPGTPSPRPPPGSRARYIMTHEYGVAAHIARRHRALSPAIHEESVAALHPPAAHGALRSYCGLDMAWANQAIAEAEASRGRQTPSTFRRSFCYDDDEHLTASWDPFWPSGRPYSRSENGSVESLRSLVRVGSRTMLHERPRSRLQERPISRAQGHESTAREEGTRPIPINYDITRLARQLHGRL